MDQKLAPASYADLAETLAYGLRFDTRGKPVPRAADVMAPIAAEHLLDRLLEAGYVMVKRPPARQHSTD